jgi:cobalt-precorrin 5A hydrolase
MERLAVIVAGFGCRAGAGVASLHDALRAAWPDSPLWALAGPEDRVALLSRLAAILGLPVIPVAPEMLAGISTPTRSAISLAARGVGSVAEAAALAGAGNGARLLVTRQISADRMASCAIAQGNN